MELGFIGLGRMGLNMVTRLLSKGHKVVAFDKIKANIDGAAANGALAASSPGKLAKSLKKPRIVWLMVPAGKIVDDVIFQDLLPHLSSKDIVIDGGNSHYRDSQRRALTLKEKDIFFLDVGTSGGLEGAASGASLTIGGEKEAFKRVKPIFESLAAPDGFGYVGNSGAGHYVKMVHNAIEYILLQAYGEGFELLEKSPYELNLAQISRLWNNGGVIRSWILELAQRALEKDPELATLQGTVGGGETGSWAVEAAREMEVPLPMTSLALALRLRSRQEDSFASKIVAALRREFGGHAVKEAKQK